MNTPPNTLWDLFCGYSAFWLLVAWFVFHLMREQRQLRKSLDVLERELETVPQEERDQANRS